MTDSPTTHELNERFGVVGKLRFEPGGGGLACARVTCQSATGSVYLHGAHVTGYQPRGHEPVLFVSGSSGYGPGKAIRGGVPICFPWFGPNASNPSAPSHGPARITSWRLAEARDSDRGITLRFDAVFEPFRISHAVTFGAELVMALTVENTSNSPATFEAAQHTYFCVSDVRQVQVTGLKGVDYLDKVDGQRPKTQGDEPIRFTGETDRVYLDTRSTCTLKDPGLGRSITVAKVGSDSTVVWNPWADKAKAMGDLGDDDWLKMLCIETANAGSNTVTLAPGGTHTMTTTVGVSRW